MSQYTVPGLDEGSAQKARAILQDRLTCLSDLHLTLKHIHWNVVGPNFIAVHQMLDPQVDAARDFSDSLAERIATLGGEPLGTPGAIVASRRWDDYKLNRASTTAHLSELDIVYDGVISDYRTAIKDLGDLDIISQDMLLGQAEKLEMFQWFVRAHLEDGGGHLHHQGDRA